MEYYTTPRTNKITPQGQSTTFGLMTSLPVTSPLVKSHPVAMLLPVMRNGTFRTTTIVKKAQENDVTSCDVTSDHVTSLPVTSHPLAMLLPVMRNGTFRTTTIVRKKARECTSGHAQNILPVMASLPVTTASGDVTSSKARAMAAPLCSPRNMP